MKKRKIELGDVFFVFTNYGLVKARIVETKNKVYSGKDVIWESEIPDDEDFSIEEYKVNILDYFNEGTSYNMKWGAWYTENLLYDSPEEAIEAVKETWL